MKSNNNTISTLQQDLQYRLWHHRLGRPGRISLSQFHVSCDGVPKLSKPALFQCAECIPTKFGKHKKGFHTKPKPLLPGEMFQMDYGFVPGLINTYPSPSDDPRLNYHFKHAGMASTVTY